MSAIITPIVPRRKSTPARKLYHDPKEALQDALAPFHAALNEARKELDGKRRAYDKAKEALRDATHWKP